MFQAVIKEDYKLALGSLALGLLFISSELRDTFGLPGAFLTLFGTFLIYQASSFFLRECPNVHTGVSRGVASWVLQG